MYVQTIKYPNLKLSNTLTNTGPYKECYSSAINGANVTRGTLYITSGATWIMTENILNNKYNNQNIYNIAIFATVPLMTDKILVFLSSNYLRCSRQERLWRTPGSQSSTRTRGTHTRASWTAALTTGKYNIGHSTKAHLNVFYRGNGQFHNCASRSFITVHGQF